MMRRFGQFKNEGSGLEIRNCEECGLMIAIAISGLNSQSWDPGLRNL